MRKDQEDNFLMFCSNFNIDLYLNILDKIKVQNVIDYDEGEDVLDGDVDIVVLGISKENKQKKEKMYREIVYLFDKKINKRVCL